MENSGDSGESPKIIRASRNASLEDLKRQAAANRVDPDRPPARSERPEKEKVPPIAPMNEKTVVELYNIMMGDNPNDANQAHGELFQRIVGAESSGVINRQDTKDDIYALLAHSTWDRYIPNENPDALPVRNPDYFDTVLDKTGKQEERDRRSDQRYKDAKLEGIYDVIYSATAGYVSAQEIDKRLRGAVPGKNVPDNPLSWVAEKFGTEESVAQELLDNRQKIVDRRILTLFGFRENEDLSKLVGTEYEASPNVDYLRMKYEGTRLPRYGAPNLPTDLDEEDQNKLTGLAAGEANRMNDLLENLEKSLGGNVDMSREIMHFIESDRINGKAKAAQYVLEVMDTLENSKADWTQSDALGKMLIRLENSLDFIENRLDRETRREIETRIKLYDSSRLMMRSGLFIDQNPTGDINIGTAVVTAQVRRHLIEAPEVEFCLFTGYKADTNVKILTDRNGRHCVDPNGRQIDLALYSNDNGNLSTRKGVAMAWDYLQMINSWRYRNVLRYIYEKYERPDDVSDFEFYKDIYQTEDSGGRKRIKYYNATVEDVNPRGETKKREVRKAIPTVVNFFQDDDDKRREKVELFVTTQLAGIGFSVSERNQFIENLSRRYRSEGVPPDKVKEKVDDEIERRVKFAQKSIRMAESLAVATLEPSRWNTRVGGGRLFVNDQDYARNDAPAEFMHFRDWRTGRPTRDRGPEATIPFNTGWGDSFLGGKTGDSKSEIASVHWIEDKNEGPGAVYAADLDHKEGYSDLPGYATVTLGRLWKLKTLMTQESFPAKDFGFTETGVSAEWFRKNIILFTTAHKTNSKTTLRHVDQMSQFVYHVMLYAVSQTGMGAGWNPTTIDHFRRAVSETPLAEYFDPYDPKQQQMRESGKITFIDAEQWKKIRSSSDPGRLTEFMRNLQVEYGKLDFSTILGGGGGGKKR